MKALTQDISTEFSLTGLREALNDARSFTSGLRDTLDGVGKSRPLDGVNKGLRDARGAARDLNDAMPKDLSPEVNVKVTGTSAAGAALRGLGRAVREALSDDGAAIDFDAVAARIKEKQRVVREAAAAEAKAGRDGEASTERADGAFRSLLSRIVGVRKAADDAGDALEKGGRQGKDGGEKTRTAAERAKSGLTAAAGASREFTGKVGELRREATRTGIELTKAFGERAIEGLRKLGEATRKASEIGVLVAGLTGLSTGGVIGAITHETAAYNIEASKLANLLGIEISAFSRLAEIARSSGVELDDLRGSLGQFAGQAAAAAQGDDVKKFFDELGVSATDANGQVKDTLTLLLEVAAAQKTKVSGARRAFILQQLFGEDDASKVVKVLDQLGGTVTDVEKLIGNVDKAGNVITAQDVKDAEAYNAALAAIMAPLRGIARELSREVLPRLTEIATRIAEVVSESRDGIVKYGVRAWTLLGEVISDVVKYFTGRGEFIKNSWLTGLLDLVALGAKGFAAAGRAVLEFGDILRGVSAGDRDFEFPWLFDLKARLDRVFGEGGKVVTAFVDLFRGASIDAGSAADGIESAVTGLLRGLENALRVLGGAAPTTFLGGVAGDARDTVGWLNELRKAVVAVASGGQVAPEFNWVSILAKTGKEAVDTVLALGKVLLDVAVNLQQFLSDIGVTGDGLATVVGKVAAFGLVAAAILAPVNAFVGMLTAIGVASAAPIAGILLLGTALGVVLAKFATWTGLAQKVFDPITDRINGVKEALDGTRKAMDASLDKYGVKPGAQEGYRKLQQARKDQGLDYDEKALSGAAPAAAAPAAAPALQADEQGVLRGLTDLVRQSRAGAGVPAPTFDADGAIRAIQAAAGARGDAILAAANAAPPGLPGAAAAPVPATTGTPLAFTVVAADGRQQDFDLQVGPADVVNALGEALQAANRNGATQGQPRFALRR